MQTITQLNPVTVKKAAFVLRAINHPLRQRILQYLLEHPGTNVTTLYNHFDLEQSIASQQLAILRREGIVTATRQGKIIQYSVSETRLHQVQGLMEQLVKK